MSGNLTLCSSSSLLESNSHWSKINQLYRVNIASYGDFISPLLSSDNSTVVIVLFLEDLIHDFNEDSDSPLLDSEEVEQRIFNMVERWNIKPWEAMELIHNVDSRQSIEL